MTMKRLIALLSLSVACTTAFTKERTLQQKRDAAAAVLDRGPQATRADATERLEPLYSTSTFTVMGRRTAGGFAVIANDDAHEAVLGYSQSRYADPMPCGLKWWLKATDTALQRGETTSYKTAETAASKGRPRSAGPLLTCEWGQGEPFNGLCPTLPPGEHCPAGCLPVAVAQVMYYHKHPAQGTGSHEYLWLTLTSGKEYRLSADFGNTMYDWYNMLDRYEPGAYSETEARAVAELVYHCGVGMEADYDLDETSAYTLDAGYAMLTYMGYNPDMVYIERSEHEYEWMELLMSEIDAGRPVIYDARKLNGGDMFTADRHAFVIDGYDADGLVHVNWGWGGTADGMYRIDNLKPFEDEEGYDVDQYMLMYVAPKQKEVPARFMYSNRDITFYQNGIYMNWYGGIGQVNNISCRPANGRLSLICEGIDGFWFSELLSAPVDGIQPLKGFQLRTSSFEIPAYMPDGRYRVYDAYYDNLTERWVRVVHDRNSINEFVVTKQGDTFTEYEGISTGVSGVKAAGNADGRVRVYDMSGRLVMEADAGSFSPSDIPGGGTFIVTNGPTARKIIK